MDDKKKIIIAASFWVAIILLFLIIRYFRNKRLSAQNALINSPSNSNVMTTTAAATPETINNPNVPYVSPVSTGSTDNYALWSAYIIDVLNKAGNTNVAVNLNKQLTAAVNNTPGAWTVNYYLDTSPYYNKFVPDWGVGYGAQTVNAGNTGAIGTGRQQLTQPITTKSVFDNATNIMSLIAKNYVQGNTNGQAIGSRQTIINNAQTQMNNNDSVNNIPEFAPQIIYLFNNALNNTWPVGNGGGAQIPANDANTIIADVTKLAPGILALVA